MRLQRKGLLTIEIMNATALRMNEALKDKLRLSGNTKEVFRGLYVCFGKHI